MVRAYDYDIFFEDSAEERADGQTISLVTEERCRAFSHALELYPNQGKKVRLLYDNEAIGESDFIGIEIEERRRFFWSRTAKSVIRFTWPETMCEELLRYWLFQAVLPLYFTTQNVYTFLHAGAVVIGDQAVLFAGMPSSGKSTLIDFLIKKGHFFLADDRVAFYEDADGFIALPSHPYLRLERSPETLGTLRSDAFHPSPSPLKTLIVLRSVSEDDEIRITPLRGMEKFEALQRQGENDFSFLKAERFDRLSRLADCTHIYMMNVPQRLDCLEKVYQTVCETVGGIG